MYSPPKASAGVYAHGSQHRSYAELRPLRHTLASDNLDCTPGVRVFFQYAGHCVYSNESAPQMCPNSIRHRYSLRNHVVCSEDPELSPEAAAEIATRGRSQQDASVEEAPVSEPNVAFDTMTDSDVPIPGDETASSQAEGSSSVDNDSDSSDEPMGGVAEDRVDSFP